MVAEHPTTEQWREIARQLREPFPAADIKQRKGRGGQQFDYIDARAVMDRLDSVVGPENWCDTYEVIDLANGAVQCTLTVYGISKQDIGYPNAPMTATDKTGNLMSDEPLKAAYSDALKRAAVQWGIGRFLYQGGAPKADQVEVPRSSVRDTVPGDITDGKPDVTAWLNSAINALADREHISGPTVAQRGMHALGISGAYTSLPEEQAKRLTKWAVAELKQAAARQPVASVPEDESF
jgi:hypothetical protein